jgi:hypothetical protein
MNLSVCNSRILTIFKVNSEVNLFEAYTEFWARLMNSLFCSYINMKHKNDIDEFLTNSVYFINFERTFAFFQMIKVLHFMDITYKDLYDKNIQSENIRKTMYKEETSVLSYYIITLILFNNYQDFLSWCNTNNTSLLQFKKTIQNLNHFCNFIETKYKTRSMIEGVNCTENLLFNINKTAKKQRELSYLINNLRMTICELG